MKVRAPGARSVCPPPTTHSCHSCPKHLPCSPLPPGPAGWNYGILAAVLAGITDAAVLQLASRALTPPAPGYRFPAFSPQFQDYDPSADHYANLARAMQEMLLQSGEDGFENATIVLLPAWPCNWDVQAKLWAPGNTSVEFSYANHTLLSLAVNPPARAGAVKWAACITA